MIEDEEIRLLMLMNGCFTRRVEPTYIIPDKSNWIKQRHGLDVTDKSPEGLYPAMIVPQNRYDEILVLMPEKTFLEFLEAWKKANPLKMKGVKEILQQRKEQEACKRVLKTMQKAVKTGTTQGCDECEP